MDKKPSAADATLPPPTAPETVPTEEGAAGEPAAATAARKARPAARKKAEPSAPPAAPAPKARKAAAAAAKPAKLKLVRDGFTIPRDEYAAIDALKARALGLGRAVKKSELLRAGLMRLAAAGDAALLRALDAVPQLKTGRPKKGRDEAAPRSAKGKAAKG